MSELNIPEHWTEATLGEISEKITYGATTSSTASGEYKFLRITDLTDSGVDWDSVPYCDIEKGERYSIYDGDIVIARTGGTVGKSYRIMSPPPNAIYASYLIKISPKKPFKQNEYLSLFFKSNFYWNEIQEKAQGAAQPNVNAAKLGEIPIPLPPTGEQERIVQKIKACFQKIDATEKSLNEVKVLLAKYRESLLSKAFRGELVPQDPKDESASKLLEKNRVEQVKNSNGKKAQEFSPISDDEKPFDLPEGWGWVRIGDLGSWSGGGTPSKENKAFWDRGKIPWVSPKDMKFDLIIDSEDKITEIALEERKISKLPIGTILFVTRSGILRHTLPICVTGVEVTINQDIKALIPYEYVLTEYLFYCFRSYEQDLLKECSKKGATVESIEFEKFKDFLFPVAPLKEQQRLVNSLKSKFMEINSSLNIVESISDILKKTKASVLEKAFQGVLVSRIEKEGTGQELLAKILDSKQEVTDAPEKKLSKKITNKETKKKAKK